MRDRRENRITAMSASARDRQLKFELKQARLKLLVFGVISIAIITQLHTSLKYFELIPYIFHTPIVITFTYLVQILQKYTQKKLADKKPKNK